MDRFPLEKLPQRSAWAAYLLDPDRDPPGEPTAYTDLETYQRIYGGVLEAHRDDPRSTREIVEAIRGRPDSERTVLSRGERLYLATTDELVDREYDVVRSALEPVLAGDETVLDLGCGWGWTLSAIASGFPEVRVVGGEYVPEGVAFARETFADGRDRISVDRFDFYGDWDSIVDGGDDCVVFTKGALVTLPESESVVDRLERFATEDRITAGVHLEQVGPHSETVLGLLRRRYSRERGYNDDLLEQLQESSVLAVTDVTYDVHGSNPLHPLTRIRWTVA
ncbi:class I SAM-dependent methyltransferase [Halopiger goleimassiliensis]|uniref:class I SAM-dependent methyltransferase n=1 Tax=Halopiger goleimassiliensis TaxID=1293048 RepID=UPI00067768B8|nr:class I SAM-dependent methyltransferase [Halopiger goleimassiliensis]